MERLIEYFSTMPSSHRTVLLVGGITFFWMLEGLFPLFRFSYIKWKHAATNIFFTITTAIVNLSLAFVMVWTSDWVTNHQFGIMSWLDFLPTPIVILIGLLFMDLIGAYGIHYLNHKVKWFWLFHLIHHTDTNVDTTTANRHHPGESFLRLFATILAVFVVGAPIYMIFLYQSLSVIFSQFNHANIILPAKLNAIVACFFVTPNMHHVHHHFQQPLTDTNYGNIFSVWDHVFGTYANVDNKMLTYGIDTHMSPQENEPIKNLLQIPFQEYRDIKKIEEEKVDNRSY
ncbi:sterol desaturase family protein [Flammeovirga agarivorans]|uniref:Sterol desaturase family protein n=1 Tax=Flammeovirga agarivorans TaxID=2726742 RepID=A0A7X8SIK1_9BACT|nr:sterol desaturase family protein [Flammeovirga agarivorans]NLR90758.1 sterol desaturase family protein [Flammeovirga agarivorans]